MAGSYDKFPADVYSEAVLAPDLEVYKEYFSESLHEINIAHCIMLSEQGLLNASETKSILQGLTSINSEKPYMDVEFDGTFEDLFFLVERELGYRIGSEVAGKLHTGRSRNDMEHTMFRLQLRDRLTNLLKQYVSLLRQLIDRAERGVDEIVLLYTHGQPAQPSTLAHYLSAAIEFILNDIDRIKFAHNLVNMSPMGAAAITTSGFSLNRNRVAHLLGFPKIVENSYGAIANVDYITGSYSAIKLGCLHLGRFVQDLVTWTGFEVSQIKVPDGFVQISSIMPQKRNPVPLEHLRLKFSLAGGGADQIVNTMHNTPFADMNDSERETQATGFAVFDRLNKALPLLAGFVDSIEIDTASVSKRINQSMATITELADHLARTEGISFRLAHSVAHKLAYQALSLESSLDQLDFNVFVESFEEVVGVKPITNEKNFRKVCSPEHFISVRKIPGGPARATIKKSLKVYVKRLAETELRIKSMENFLHSTNAECQRLVDVYIKQGN
ncbi:MAG: argininosuccinate lyase [Rhodobacteraceae bacterium]|nr:argininosuccinate lyase [Paracoccaceae bacterium]MDG1298683.1 argininosuccinate lyase [Paracoccaceae bacterium]